MSKLLHVRHFGHTIMHLVPSMNELPTPGVFSLALSFAASFLMGAVPVMWMPAGMFLGLLLFLMTVDLLAQYFALPEGEKQCFLWEREIVGKFMLIVLVVLSLVLDVVIYVAAAYLPTSFPVLDRGWLMITMTTELWLIAAETLRITRIVGFAAGEENVPPTISALARQIQWVIRSLRRVDEARVREKGGNVEAMPRRWMDDLTDEQAAEIVTLLQKGKVKPLEVEGVVEEKTRNPTEEKP